jgi:hypothetical protein
MCLSPGMQIWKTFKPDEEVEVSENDQLIACVPGVRACTALEPIRCSR